MTQTEAPPGGGAAEFIIVFIPESEAAAARCRQCGGVPERLGAAPGFALFPGFYNHRVFCVACALRQEPSLKSLLDELLAAPLGAGTPAPGVAGAVNRLLSGLSLLAMAEVLQHLMSPGAAAPLTPKAGELDVVRLTRDLPRYGLVAGDEMAVISAFTTPDEAYDLELDHGGRHVIAYSVKPDCFDVTWRFEDHQEPEIRTTHGLAFEVAAYEKDVFGDGWRRFRVGTCHGLWRAADDAYEILAVGNREPGNGHFEDVLEWFEYSAGRDGKAVRFLELMNADFREHLINKRGFVPEGNDDLIKHVERAAHGEKT